MISKKDSFPNFLRKITDVLEKYYGLMIMAVFAGGVLLGMMTLQIWLAWVAVVIIVGNLFFVFRRKVKAKRGFFIFGRRKRSKR